MRNRTIRMQMGFVLAVGMATFAGMGLRSGAEGTAHEVKPVLQNSIALGAHRGGADMFPENTVLAYRECAERWPDILIELDVFTTADGALVAIHDRTVDRTTNGSGAVTEMTLEQIKALDAGYKFTPDRGETFPYRGQGLTIPTLEEALMAAPNHRYLVETKGGEGVAEAALAVIRNVGAEDRVIVASFQPEHMAYFRDNAPEIARCFDMQTGMGLLTALRSDAWDDYVPVDDVLSVMTRMHQQFGITAEDLAKLRDKGIVSQIHTINDRERKHELLELGYASILTDNPQQLAEVLEARKHGEAAPVRETQ